MNDHIATLRIKLMTSQANIPKRSTEGSAGFDLFAAETTILPPSTIVNGNVSIGRALVSTKLAIAIPSNCVGKIGARSGLSINNNIEVGAGWIDSDFRGEIFIELKNLSPNEFRIAPGMRIAQLFILPLANVNVISVSELPPSKRDQGGFGSTGL